MNSSFSSNHPGANHPILDIVLLQKELSYCKESDKFSPTNNSDDLCLFFCLYPSSKARGKTSFIVSVHCK